MKGLLVEDARAAILAAAVAMPPETVALDQAIGRVLHAPVHRCGQCSNLVVVQTPSAKQQGREIAAGQERRIPW